MKCIVCGKVYDGGECPVCQFPDVQIPTLPGERERAIEKLKPAIDTYRASFLQTIKVEIVIYRWKDRDGHIALDQEERILLGTGTDLGQGEHWLPLKFARIPDLRQLSVTISITTERDTIEKQVMLPNLQRAELQQIGAEIDQECNIRLMLRNDTDVPTRSEPIYLF